MQNDGAGTMICIHKRERHKRTRGRHVYGVRDVEFQGDDRAGGQCREFHDEQAAGDVGAVYFALERAGKSEGRPVQCNAEQYR